MQLINETQLDYSDVLMKPKRSTILSRKDACVFRTYKYKWSPESNIGTGIINANMGTVGNFTVAEKMLEKGLFCTLHKHYSVKELTAFYEKGNEIIVTSDQSSVHRYDMTKCFVSIGLKDAGLQKLTELKTHFDNKGTYFPPLSICIDVPNGYIPSVKALVKETRKTFPNACIMVGNIVTGDITEDLILSGADIVKVGIGPGCIPEYATLEVVYKDEYESGEYTKIHTISMGELYQLYKEDKLDTILINTPDNLKSITNVYYKGWLDMNKIKTENGFELTCSYNHKIETPLGFKYAFELNEGEEVLTVKGWSKVISNIAQETKERCYDFTVDSEEHRYYADGISSHNSQCLTRRQTGVGRPQLSTIIECADAAHGVGGMVCADGGITCAGDMCKAFGAGADFVMIGGLYAGTDEAEGEIIEKMYRTNEYSYYIEDYNVDVESDEPENKILSAAIDLSYGPDKPVYKMKQFKLFYGMSSGHAQCKFGEGMPKYRASEGRVSEVPYVGSIDNVNNELLGGLRSCMTYIGARRLKDISKCCTFYRVNHQLNEVFARYDRN